MATYLKAKFIVRELPAVKRLTLSSHPRLRAIGTCRFAVGFDRDSEITLVAEIDDPDWLSINQLSTASTFLFRQ